MLESRTHIIESYVYTCFILLSSRGRPLCRYTRFLCVCHCIGNMYYNSLVRLQQLEPSASRGCSSPWWMERYPLCPNDTDWFVYVCARSRFQRPFKAFTPPPPRTCTTSDCARDPLLPRVSPALMTTLINNMRCVCAGGSKISGTRNVRVNVVVLMWRLVHNVNNVLCTSSTRNVHFTCVYVWHPSPPDRQCRNKWYVFIIKICLCRVGR